MQGLFDDSNDRSLLCLSIGSNVEPYGFLSLVRNVLFIVGHISRLKMHAIL